MTQDSNIENIPNDIVALYGDFSETVNDLWSTVLRSTGDTNPIRNATSCLSIALLFAIIRHPEWGHAVATKIQEAFEILDPVALRELQENADIIVESISINEEETHA